MVNIYYENLEQETINNENYRKVVFTNNFQLVLMSIKPKQEIGEEVHQNTDQFFRIEQGFGIAIVDGKTYELHDGMCIIVPKNTKHNIINTHHALDLKLYTIYTPPEHPDGLIEPIKPVDGGYQEYLNSKKQYQKLKKLLFNHSKKK